MLFEEDGQIVSLDDSHIELVHSRLAILQLEYNGPGV